ncbi:MAG: hypothetical protein WCL04_06890, partial [Verrucomicrobiota bacterium]
VVVVSLLTGILSGRLDFSAENLAFFVGSLVVGPFLGAWLVWRFAGYSPQKLNVGFWAALVVGAYLLTHQLEKDHGAATEFMRNFRAQGQALQERQLAAVSRAGFDNLFSFSWLTDRSLVPPRRAALQEVLAAHAEARRHITDGEAMIRAGMEQSGESATAIENALTSYRRGLNGRAPLNLKFLEADDRIVTAALALLDLFEAQWGHWRIKGGRAEFDDPGALVKYNTAMTTVQASAKEETDYQKQIQALGPGP